MPRIHSSPRPLSPSWPSARNAPGARLFKAFALQLTTISEAGRQLPSDDHSDSDGALRLGMGGLTDVVEPRPLMIGCGIAFLAVVAIYAAISPRLRGYFHGWRLDGPVPDQPGAGRLSPTLRSVAPLFASLSSPFKPGAGQVNRKRFRKPYEVPSRG